MSSPTFNKVISPTIDGSIGARINYLRQLSGELRTRPVTGSFAKLRKLVYQTIRPAFTRQHTLNSATIDVIESLHRELVRGRWASPTAPLSADATQVIGSAGQLQDQAAVNNIRPLAGFAAVHTAPAELRMPERVALYSLVFGLQPRKCLEIGSFRGGSTAIICGAMDDTGFGHLACVDPEPRIDSDLWPRLRHRCEMYVGMSPDILPQVASEMGPFDFAWIDGNHTYECLRADIAGVLPTLTDRAYILFHDAHYGGVKRAIDEAVAATPQLIDCGLMSVEPTVLEDNGEKTSWAGMRLLRFERSMQR